MVLSRLSAGVAGFALGGPVGAVVGALGVHVADEVLSAERGRGGIVAAKSLLDVRAHEPIRRVALWSAPLMVNQSRALNPLIDVVNGVLGVSRIVGGDIMMPKPEHHFITVETHDHTFYVLQKCHTGDIRFVRKDTLAAAINEGVAWGGTHAGVESAVLEEEVSVEAEHHHVPLVDLSDWVHTQEPVYVLKYANCQHFAHGLMGWLRKRTGRPEPRRPALSPIADFTPSASPAPLRFVPIDSAAHSRHGSPCPSPALAHPAAARPPGSPAPGAHFCTPAASPCPSPAPRHVAAASEPTPPLCLRALAAEADALSSSPVFAAASPPPSPEPILGLAAVRGRPPACGSSAGGGSSRSGSPADHRAISCSPVERVEGAIVCSPAL